MKNDLTGLQQSVSLQSAPTRAARLRQMIGGGELQLAMEAHNGFSARIVEESGFPLIWASGLTIASSLGVRDHNEASWTQTLGVLESIVESTSLPVLFDGDTGFGDFNNFRVLVRKLCKHEAAGVTVEDKLFPKLNSFAGGKQQLADPHEFCGKIKAGKDSQTDPDFCIVARTEALIAGHSVAQALERAELYRQAGADAIFIHSKESTAEQILAFASEWSGRLPLVVAPTMYYRTPPKVLEAAGVSIYICANHNLRACLRAMRMVCRQIMADRNIVAVEDSIGTIKEIFDLLDYSELDAAEARYLGVAAKT
jgi:phosphoenolpyruvate phosphomutase